MTAPVVTVRIDFDNDGVFTTSGDDVTSYVAADSLSWTRGRSADFSAEATGAAQFTLVNTDGRFTTAPIKAKLIPGRPVLIHANYSSTDYPLFFGYIERVSPDAWSRTVTITCYDPLGRMSETDVTVPAGVVRRSARDFRAAILEDYERGNRNLIVNPHFATNTDYWVLHGGAGSLSRITTDHCPDTAGNTCGQVVAPSLYHVVYAPAWVVPQVFAGVTYRASVWLKKVSGGDWVKLGLGGHPTVGTPVGTFKDVRIDGTWQKFTITYTPAATKGASEAWDASGIPFSLTIEALDTTTYLVDGGQITRGQVTYPYSAAGTGRSPNWCANGSFDGDTIAGWYDGWTNLIPNPSFETDLTGWTGLTARVVSDPLYGSCHATMPANGGGAWIQATGTFKQGVTYDFRLRYKLGTAAYCTPSVTMRSSGTPADTSAAASNLGGGPWVTLEGSWTPSADRADAVFVIATAGEAGKDIKIDGAMTTRRTGSVAPFDYSDTGPGGIGSFASQSGNWSDTKYGSMDQYFYTPATAGAGRLYDFYTSKPVFLAGQPYTLSMWVKPYGPDMPYKLGIGGNKGDGTWDEASTTGTLTADTYTKISVTWTPSADRAANQPMRVVAYIYQTDATARSWVNLDGVRVIAGNAADDFEMAAWSLGTESDIYASGATVSGSALSCLSQINALAMTRHWIKPSMTAPYYTYVTAGRAASKSSAETFNNDMKDLTDAEIDRASIINVVPITNNSGTEFYSDPTSVTTYGPRPGQGINGAAFFDSTTLPDAVGAAMLTRYKNPRARPTMVIANRFPSQLQRDLDDLITVNNTRLSISGGQYLIASMDTFVTAGGKVWTTSYRLEESV